MATEEMREKLADLQHEQWSGWMKYMFSKSQMLVDNDIVVPAYLANRWRRQMETPYSELPEEEKESDRIEADKYLPLFKV
jgi:hypothetical protein